MFETTLWNYGGHVGGHAEVHHHGAAYIYTKYSEILFANNSAKKCSFAPKIIPELLFKLIALQAHELFFSFWQSNRDISKF